MPAHIAELGNGLLQPVCNTHQKPWKGPQTYQRDGAVLNVTVHNTDVHRAADDMLEIPE